MENPRKAAGAVARRQAAVYFPSDIHFKVASHRSWPRCMRLSSVSRRVVVQTLEVEPIRGVEVALDHAASTAFQISGTVLCLTRSLSSLN
jgi:hypothetical protein